MTMYRKGGRVHLEARLKAPNHLLVMSQTDKRIYDTLSSIPIDLGPSASYFVNSCHTGQFK